jgi:lipid A 4'-phosphatase
MHIFLLFLLACLVSLAFPGIDLIVSGWFFDADKGFYLKNQDAVVFLYKGVPMLSKFFQYALVAAFVLGIGPQLRVGQLNKRYASLYLLLVFVIGPGLVVNKLVKDHSGRARPEEVRQFGGSKQFTPPLTISDQCETNCSFVSGHASVGFFLCAIGFADTLRRRRWMVLGIVVGSVFGIARIMQGRHYFFDVVFCFFMVYYIAWLVDNVLRWLLAASHARQADKAHDIKAI